MSGNWRAEKKFWTLFDKELSADSQAVLEAGKSVPATVRSAAREELANVRAIQKLFSKAKSLAGLSVAMNASAKSFITSLEPVLDYIGAQCGSVSRSLAGVSGTEVTVPYSSANGTDNRP
jgi:hypothetical protein